MGREYNYFGSSNDYYEMEDYELFYDSNSEEKESDLMEEEAVSDEMGESNYGSNDIERDNGIKDVKNNSISFKNPNGNYPPGYVHINYRGVKTILSPFDFTENKDGKKYYDGLYYMYGEYEFQKVKNYIDVVEITLKGQKRYFNIMFMPKVTKDGQGKEFVHPKEKEGNYVLLELVPEKDYGSYVGLFHFGLTSYNFETGVSTPVEVKQSEQIHHVDFHTRFLFKEIDMAIDKNLEGQSFVNKDSVKITDINLFFHNTTASDYRQKLISKVEAKYPEININVQIGDNHHPKNAFHVAVNYEFEKLSEK